MGLIFVAVYFCWFLLCAGLAVSVSDPKTAYVLAQFSILPG
jgi:hypothetical protein